MPFVFFVLSIFGFFDQAQAYVSLSTSGTVGYYRDINQKAHLPIYYSLSSTSIHSNGAETSLDLILNNDISQSSWAVVPSQVLLMYPLGVGQNTNAQKRSRLLVGRQLFIENFDIQLLDGVQLPYYWSGSGGVWIYGGQSHTMDLLDSAAMPIAGISIFETLVDSRVKVGFSGRRNDLNEKILNGSVLHNFDGIWLQPQLLYKLEWDPARSLLSQQMVDLLLNLSDDISLGLSHSVREPRRINPDQNIFLYRIFALSPEYIEEMTLNWQIDKEVGFQTLGRLMTYKAGTNDEQGHQVIASVSWLIRSNQNLTPSVGKLHSYGGDMYDAGVLYKIRMNDKVEGQLEVASAYYEKINRILGWAHTSRAGLKFALAPRLSALTWLEIERNPLFDFDGRVKVNVTYFN